MIDDFLDFLGGNIVALCVLGIALVLFLAWFYDSQHPCLVYSKEKTIQVIVGGIPIYDYDCLERK